MSTVREVLEKVGRTGEMPRAQAVLGALESPSPWFVRAAVGVGTWVGAFLVGLFLVLSEIASSKPGAAVVGVCLLVTAGVISRVVEGIAKGQAVLATSLGGQALLIYAVSNGFEAVQIALTFAALQAIMFFAARDTTHRFLSAASGLAAVWFAMLDSHVPTAPIVLAGLGAACWLLLDEAELLGSPGASLVRPGAYGLATGVMGITLVQALPASVLDSSLRHKGWAGEPIALVAGLVAIGAWVGLRAFREASRPLAGRGFLVAAAGGLATVAFAFQVPALLVAFVLLVVAHTRREYVLGGLACTFLAACYGVFYFELSLPLLVKSYAIAGTGLVFFAMFAALRGVGSGAAEERARAFGPQGLVLIGATLATLVLVGGLAASREGIRTSGRVVLLELAPVDPRSLIQGDYMVLRYAIEEPVRDAMGDAHDAVAVLALDERGVGSFVRLDDGREPGPNEQRVRVRKRDWTLRFGAENYFIEEGSGEAYAGAKFGELRASASGTVMVTGLRNAELGRMGGRGE